MVCLDGKTVMPIQRALDRHQFCEWLMSRRQLAVAIVVSIKTEHIEEITEGWAVERDIGILVLNSRIGEIVPAACSQGPQAPIAFDELQDRDVISIAMVHMAASREI